MHEQMFLDKLASDPTDDEVRLVYADWLDDNGRPAHAEFLRLEHVVRTGKVRLRALAAEMPSDWLGAVFGRYQIELVAYPPHVKIQVIKLIREYTSLGLAEAKDLSEALPSQLLIVEARRDVAEARRQLDALGATLRIVGIAPELG